MHKQDAWLKGRTVPIVAIATAQGRGGIGVVRVSGTNIRDISMEILGCIPKPRFAHYGPFFDGRGASIDCGIALWFPSPASYTGEDVLELQGHGGPIVLQMILKRVLEVGQPLGVRIAYPGEFTERAYRNGKMDLLQAEAVADLICASTERAARSAARCGLFSAALQELTKNLEELQVLVEAGLDFPEEDVDFFGIETVSHKFEKILDTLEKLIASSRRGAILRDGIKVALIGPPNVGKSSILNRFAGEPVAIVTSAPGTTRDSITHSFQIQGIPVSIVDTAGLRETEDEVESIGIERSYSQAEKADLVLLVIDVYLLNDLLNNGHKNAFEIASIFLKNLNEKRVLLIVNKIDCAAEVQAGDFPQLDENAVFLSAKKGDGMGILEKKIIEYAGGLPSDASDFIARERHIRLLEAAKNFLFDAKFFREKEQWDLFAEGLRLARERLGEIVGKFSSDDLLGEIFRRFCIGK